MAPVSTAVASTSVLFARAGPIEPRQLNGGTKQFVCIGLPIIAVGLGVASFRAAKAPPGRKIDEFFISIIALIIVATPPLLIWVTFYYHYKGRILAKPPDQREEFKRSHPHLAKFFGIDPPAPSPPAPVIEGLPEHHRRPQLEQVPVVVQPDEEGFTDPDQMTSKTAATSIATDDEAALHQKYIQS